MRIAHLTFHHAYNFGGALQAYATQKILESFGHEVVAVDYHSSRRINVLRTLTMNIRPLHDRLRSQMDRHRFSSVKQFDTFRNSHFKFGRSSITKAHLSRACGAFDAVVVGSDQVWSPKWVRAPYFADFPLPATTRRIALAACCGFHSPDTGFQDYCREVLGRFYAISTRNRFTAEFVESVTGRESTVTCDPTLVVDIPAEPTPGSNMPEEYAVAYILNRHGSSLKIASRVIAHLKRETGLPVYSIPPPELMGNEPLQVDGTVCNISPLQWLHLVENAAYVVTDSFHGTALSIKKNRNLLVVDSGYDSVARIRSLLEDFALPISPLRSHHEVAPALAQLAAIPWTAVNRQVANAAARYTGFVARHLG